MFNEIHISSMLDFLKLIGTAILCLIGIVLSLALLAWPLVIYEQRHPCVRSHQETQVEMPMYLQPGKDGGISIPLGNMKQVQVTVCDERL